MGTFSLHKILIVENELLIARDIKELLIENHFNEVFTAINYDAAINSIESISPQLVIIDVNLGSNKDGIDLANYLLQYRKAIPFIFITSYNDNVLLDKIINSNPYGFISKPFKKHDVIIAVKIAFNICKNRSIDFKTIDNPYLTDAPYIIKKIIDYIDKNINNKIEIDDLVKLTNWKKHHFIRIFSEYMGLTPYNYVLISKIEHAKMLLADDKLKLEFIAYDLGFQSYVNFARTFKNYTLLSPKEFRNKLRIQYF
jgi:YesN/AraC family two-component response regulator